MKKGFTLIELLAVIVIVAIITLIATPIISNIVNNSKVGALKSSAYGLLEASNLYYAQNGSKGIRFDINDNVISSNDTTKLLNYKGNIKRGTIIIDKKGNTTICITDGANSAYKNYNDNDITTVTKETCNIPSSSSIVYLESSGATRSELNNQELTDLVMSMQDEIDSLKSTKADKTEVETISTITIDKAYPIGSIYISTTDSTVEDVQSKLGGTWESYASGKTLVGIDNEQTEFNEVNKIGGEKTHTLTVNEMPSHAHTVGSGIWNATLGASHSNCSNAGSSYENFGYKTLSTDKHCNWYAMHAGGSGAHNNLQPYITVYMYKRVS